jgi:hypothetical protein
MSWEAAVQYLPVPSHQTLPTYPPAAYTINPRAPRNARRRLCLDYIFPPGGSHQDASTCRRAAGSRVTVSGPS